MFSDLGILVATTALICPGAAPGVVPTATAEVARAGAWAPAVALSDPGLGVPPADSAVSADGDMAVVWDREGEIQLAQRPVGGTWGSAETVTRLARTPRLDYDEGGHLLLAWSAHRPGRPARIKVRAFTVGDGWGATQVVSHRRTGTVSVVDLDVNAGGEAVLAWTWNARGLVSRGSTTGEWSTGARVPQTDRMDVALGDGGMAALLVQRAIPARGDAADLLLQVARQPRDRDWGAFRVVQRLSDFGPPWVGPGGVTVDSAGTTTVAWCDQRSATRWQIKAIRARQGSRWGAPVVLAAKVAWTEFPVRVEGNASGDVLVTYTPTFGNRTIMAARRPSGGPWSPPTRVARLGDYILDWDAAVAPNGRALAVWSRSSGPGSWGRGVHARLMSVSGQWRAAVRLSGGQTINGHARLAAMNGGVALAVWAEQAGSLAFEITARTRP